MGSMVIVLGFLGLAIGLPLVLCGLASGANGFLDGSERK